MAFTMISLIGWESRANAASTSQGSSAIRAVARQRSSFLVIRSGSSADVTATLTSTMMLI
jgi:hypothetical protein